MKNGRKWIIPAFILLLAIVVVGILWIGKIGPFAPETPAAPEGEAFAVGVLQFVEHPALDASTEFFLKALADNGLVDGENLKVTVLNPSADSGAMQLMSDQLATGGNNLLLGVATPAVQALAAKTDEIPILGVAVTDYVGAGLIVSNEAPGINISGTTDMNPIDRQIDLLLQLVPDAKTVGICYASNEVNSQIQADIAKAELEKRGVAVEIKMASAIGDVQQTIESLMGKVDAMYIPTDNLMASAAAVLTDITVANKVPVIVGEGNQVQGGGLATVGLNYEKMGYQTGMMALRILKDGANPAEMPIEASAEVDFYVNTTTAELLGITIPQEILDAAVIFE